MGGSVDGDDREEERPSVGEEVSVEGTQTE